MRRFFALAFCLAAAFRPPAAALRTFGALALFVAGTPPGASAQQVQVGAGLAVGAEGLDAHVIRAGVEVRLDVRAGSCPRRPSR